MTMKSLLSPSPSSSTYFDANNICTSGGGCLVGVLRRLLRSSSDRIDDVTSLGSLSNYNNGQKNSNGIEAANSSSTPSPLGPGLVARLMGLDSMPDFTPIAPNSVLRSRSMNSAMDHSEILEQGHHRRVKTSVSLPTFIDQENDEYLVLSFEELEPNERKCEMGSRKVKQRRSRKCENKENRTERASESKKKKNQETEEMQNRSFSVDFGDNTVPRLKPLNRNEISEEEQSKRRRRKKKKKMKMSYGGDTIQKLEAESSSEDSSPVSVLDFTQLYDIDHEFQSDLNSRRKLSQQLEKHEQPCPSSDQETEASEDSFVESRKQDSHSSEMGLWGSIYRLVQGDLVTESNWSYRKTCNFEDFGDMCEDLEVQILDQLFHELVLDQLSGPES